jgi:hypothetical protein
MGNHILGLIFVVGIISGCTWPISNPGGLTVGHVSAETKDDIASCSMGISSETALKAGASMEANGGKVDLSLKDELKGAFVEKFGEKDALAAMGQYQVCMDDRYKKRQATKKQVAISACKAAWTCDMNVVAGVCACNQIVKESGKKYGWTDLRMAQEYTQLCSSKKILQCWPPAGELNKMRAECQTTLSEANIPMPSLDSATCKVSPS